MKKDLTVKTIDLTEIVLRSVKHPQILLINCSESSMTELIDGYITSFYREDVIEKIPGKVSDMVGEKRAFTVLPKYTAKVPISSVSKTINKVGIVYKLRVGRKNEYIGTCIVIKIVHDGTMDFIAIQ